MTVPNSLQMLNAAIINFSVIKPHFPRRLSRLFFSAGSRLSRIFRGQLAGLAQITAGGRLSRRLGGLALTLQSGEKGLRISPSETIILQISEISQRYPNVSFICQALWIAALNLSSLVVGVATRWRRFIAVYHAIYNIQYHGRREPRRAPWQT